MAYEDILDMIHEQDLPYPPPEWFPDRPSGLPWEGYYYSAYGIAVKHGFPGTEEEWLLSLKGERGSAVELRYDEYTNHLQYKYDDSESWQNLMSLTELQTELEAATIAEVEAARDAAEGHATSAASYAATASGYAADAASSASSAGTSATSASSSATSASTSADAAALSATAASGYADDADDAKTAAQTASANAQTSARNASTSAAAAAESATDAAASAAEAAAILEEFTTPTASATTLDSGQPATASYVSGHFTFGLPRGGQGIQGNPGVSPTIVTTSIAGGHRVTVTDAQGTRYFDVMDGEGSGDMTSAVYDADSAVATAGGIAEYVAANGGKIDTIKKNGTALPITNKAVDISVPTALSELSADSTHRLVTDAEKSTWNSKQAAISDLATIRSGAAAGATAVQTETDPTVPSWAKQTTKPSYTASEVGAIATSEKGAAGGVAPLNSSSKIDDAYLPSYVSKASGSSSFTMGRDSNGIYVDY